MPRLRLRSERQLGDNRSLARERLMQSAVLLRVDDIEAAGDDGDAAGFEGAKMGCGIDTTRQARHDDDAALPKRGREVAAEAPTIGRGIARPDHRYNWAFEQFGPAKHRKHRRRVFDRPEPA